MTQQFQVRYSAKFTRERRRQALGYGIFGIVVSILSLILGVHAMRAHRWVDIAPGQSHLFLPPWFFILISFAFLALNLWMMWKNRPPSGNDAE
jgi:hypothetical protein